MESPPRVPHRKWTWLLLGAFAILTLGGGFLLFYPWAAREDLHFNSISGGRHGGGMWYFHNARGDFRFAIARTRQDRPEPMRLMPGLQALLTEFREDPGVLILPSFLLSYSGRTMSIR